MSTQGYYKKYSRVTFCLKMYELRALQTSRK